MLEPLPFVLRGMRAFLHRNEPHSPPEIRESLYRTDFSALIALLELNSGEKSTRGEMNAQLMKRYPLFPLA